MPAACTLLLRICIPFGCFANAAKTRSLEYRLTATNALRTVHTGCAFWLHRTQVMLLLELTLSLLCGSREVVEEISTEDNETENGYQV